MEMAIIYIGMAQCLFSMLLIFSKRPLYIADKILGYWLLVSSLLFIYLFLKKQYNIESFIWQTSFSLTIAFPEFLVLYSKYITTGQQKFKKKDFLFFLPSFITLIVIIIYYIFQTDTFFSYEINQDFEIWPLTTLRYLYYITLWGYSFLAVYFIFRYKKQINQSYSFESYKINLSWLLVIIISYFVTYNSMIITTSIYFKDINFKSVNVLLNGIQLINIYILSYFGFRQQQLQTVDNDKTSVVLSRFTFNEQNSTRYQKSGLKDATKAKEYLEKLVEYMNTGEPWKENELSVARLSELSNIPAHYITQILNDNMHKNFYTFVNEYRTEYAKKIIVSKKYKAYSILAIAYESGFNSKAAFNSFFKKYTGLTPTGYKKKFTI